MAQRRNIIETVARRALQPIRELIGYANSYVRVNWIDRYKWLATTDFSQADYSWYDRARRGKARGLEISGLLLKPITSKIAAWALGVAPSWRVADDEEASDDLNRWYGEHHAKIVRAYEEALNLGDCYLVVNADLTLTIVPPHMVTVMTAADNYAQIVGWKITERTYRPESNGASEQVIETTYTATERVVTITGGASVGTRTRRYRNLIGMIPVIHIGNFLGADERFGRPEAEPLIPLLQAYGNVFDAAIKGNIRQGRPTPVIEKMGDARAVAAFWSQFGRQERQTLPNGTVETVEVVDFDADQLLTLGNDATFKYASPSPFIGETEKILGLFFYLLIEHSEVPEYVMGNAIASSKASADAQQAPFVRFIEKKRGIAEGWLKELARVVLAYQSIMNARITNIADLSLRWQSMTDDDAEVVLSSVQWAYGAGLLDDKTALSKLPLDIQDVGAVLERARQQLEERRQQAQADMDAQIDRLANTPDDNADEAVDGEIVPDQARLPWAA